MKKPLGDHLSDWFDALPSEAQALMALAVAFVWVVFIVAVLGGGN